MSDEIHLRVMKYEDLDFAAHCTDAVGWVSEDRAGLEGFYQNDPNGCWLAEVDDTPVGICIATPYGRSGFVGELIVLPEWRGRGIGTQLLRTASAYLRSHGAETVYLDGVLKAVGLYERNGFRKVCRSLRFLGKLAGRPSPQVRSMQATDLAEVFALDRTAFGADRSGLLQHRFTTFPEMSLVLVEKRRISGYLLGRRGTKPQGPQWASVGPWVAGPAAEAPLKLLESLADRLEGSSFSLGALECNTRAVGLMQALGFQARPDSPWRMANGPGRNLGAAVQCLAVGGAATG